MAIKVSIEGCRVFLRKNTCNICRTTHIIYIKHFKDTAEAADTIRILVMPLYDFCCVMYEK